MSTAQAARKTGERGLRKIDFTAECEARAARPLSRGRRGKYINIIKNYLTRKKNSPCFNSSSLIGYQQYLTVFALWAMSPLNQGNSEGVYYVLD